LASAVNLVGDWALSAKPVDADDTDEVLLALNGPRPGLAVFITLGGVASPPL